MPSKMRHLAERIGLALIAILGIVVLVLDQVGWLDRLDPVKTIPKITLLILSTVTIFLLLEVERFQALERLDKRLAMLDIDEKAKQLKDKQYNGLVKVHPELIDDIFINYVRSAKKVAILQTWMPNVRALLGALVAAANRGAEVRILLLFPNSGVAKLRTAALRAGGVNKPDDHVKLEVQHCLAQLAMAREGIRERKRGCLQVRVYNSLPSISVYRADGHYLVGMFLHGELAVKLPQYEVDGAKTVLAQRVQDELDNLWKIGRDLDLANWREELDLIQFDSVLSRDGGSDGRS